MSWLTLVQLLSQCYIYMLLTAELSVSKLNDKEIQLLLDLHNRARSMVNPIATKM